MAIYISSEFNINPNIAKKPSTVLDSSWVYGSMVYADSVAELPTHPKLVRQGNLGSVKDPTNPNKSILYQANIENEKIVWSKLKTGSASTNGGVQEVYYTPDELENLTQTELEDLPEDILVVSNNESTLVPNDLLNSLLTTINTLQKEVNRIKNAFNDMSAVNIEELNSNYGSYISFLENQQPRTEVDWKDSSNGEIVYNGTSSKYGTPSGEKVKWINSDSSSGWYETWKGRDVSIYGSNEVNNNIYPYYDLPEDGVDPDTNMLADGADEKLTLRHFAPKYAKTYAIMDKYKTSLIPFELVLCLENNTLYCYNLNKNKMIPIAGGTGGGNTDWGDIDSPDNPTPTPPTEEFNVSYEVDQNGVLIITSNDNTIFVDNDGILNIVAEIDNDNILHLDDKTIVNPTINVQYEVDQNGIINITSTNGAICVDADGCLNVVGELDNNNILNLQTQETTNNIKFEFDETTGEINILSKNAYVDSEGFLNLDMSVDNQGNLNIN